MDKMLTPQDIRSLVGSVRLIKFDTLIGYETINDLLPKPRDCCIIFWEIESMMIGHYTALCRDKDSYIFFDSYGHTEQEDFSYIPMTLRKQLNIKYDYLKELLKGKKVINNHVDFQKMKNGVNTCGRFVAMFLYVFKKGYSLKYFQTVMKENLKGFKSYDEMAVDFT